MSHLGGHGNRVNLEEGAIKYLHKALNLESMIDVGCAAGTMIGVGGALHMKCWGIEGDPEIWNQTTYRKRIYLHDFTKGPPKLKQDTYDLAYSSEFLEHVEEKYMDNYMTVFERCKYVLYTAAPEKWTGIHHVNMQNHEYWTKQFNARGFIVDPYLTVQIRKFSTMNENYKGPTKQFVKMRGMFLRNTRAIDKLVLYQSLPSERIKENYFTIGDSFEWDEEKSMSVTIKNMYREKVRFPSQLPLVSFIGTKEEARKSLKCLIEFRSN